MKAAEIERIRIEKLNANEAATAAKKLKKEQ